MSGVWLGDSQHLFACALLTLFDQLVAEFPDQAWQVSGNTGTISGDQTHIEEGDKSDHNPWLNNTVRAMDVASGLVGGPDCEALFDMGNALFAAHDPRIWPDGYVIYQGRISDPANPGGFKPYIGTDQHDTHLHFSASQTPAGYNSTLPWPLPGTPEDPTMTISDADAAKIAAAVWNYPVSRGAAPQPAKIWLADARNLAAGANTTAQAVLAAVTKLGPVAKLTAALGLRRPDPAAQNDQRDRTD